MLDEAADLIVVGGGAMGLATAWSASRDRRVILVERFEHGHHRGASHGAERIFRHGYDDRVYVRLALAADELWRQLEAETGRTLIDRLGCVDHGDEPDVAAIEEACAAEGVHVEWCAATEAARRWPGLRFDGPVLHQPSAGRVRAADALDALRDAAMQAGADLHFEQRVVAIEPDADGVRVRTATGHLSAPCVVVAAGAWTTDLLSDLIALPPLITSCELVGFFRPRDASDWPSFIHRAAGMWYGLPSPTGLVKVGEHHAGPVATGDTRSFAVDPAGMARLRQYVTEWLPGVDPEAAAAATCLYTSTTTEDFVLDRVGNVVVGAGFSGHGFKFTPEIGRILASMAAGEAAPSPPFAVADRSAAMRPGSHR
jgi:sarcosine oxidase